MKDGYVKASDVNVECSEMLVLVFFHNVLFS